MKKVFDVKVRLFATKHFIIDAENEADMETLACDAMKDLPKGQLIPEFDVVSYEVLDQKEALKRVLEGKAL